MDLSGLLSVIEGEPGVRLLQESLGRPTGDQTIGVPDAAKPAALAAAVRRWAGPVLIVTSRPDRAEALADDLAAWLGPDAAPRVLLFPARDAVPYERLAPPLETVRDRLRAVLSLARGEQRIIVASALAVAQRTLSPRDVREATRTLRAGGRLEMEAFLRDLAGMGYTLQPLVQEAGETSRRGGIIDVFPPCSELPVRIELVGSEIESLRLFDPATQRSAGAVEELEITAAQELFPAGLEAEIEALARADCSRCPPAVRERFQEEVSMLRAGLPFRDRHCYVPLLAPAPLLDHLADGALLVLDEEPDLEAAVQEAEEQAEAARAELEGRGEIPLGLPSPLETWPRLREAIGSASGGSIRLARWATEEHSGALRLPFGAPAAYGGQLRKLVSETVTEARAGRRTVIVSQQAQRLAELFQEQGQPAAVASGVVAQAPLVALVQGSLPEGWRLSADGVELTLLTDTEIFGFAKQRRGPPRRAINREAFLAELTEGSYVVHIDHGIGRFAGLVRMSVDGHEREYLEVRYAEGDKLFVPTDQLDRVSRYIGPSDREPHLTRLGSGEWQRAKQRVRGAVALLARDLLQLYAAREALPGHAFPPDAPWQMELEASFPYVETADQTAAIAAVKRDMETPRPMDRLVCGDVGYGKTEIAVRAAFKAALDGRQAAVLVPTTVLAQQHYETFRERLAAFPVRVDVLSRFRSDAEQREIVEALAAGTIDIVIGTHRLLQKDVSFKDLGLAVIDEEQRFGVAHKEHLKKMRREVDVLTLSATPIPRTLYMALGGIRDMSTMETPPEERLPIKTYVSEFDDHLVREAILRELERGGQVYFVHNRVHNIEMIAAKLRDAVPEATIGIGHGQMDEHELERAMGEFTHGRTDVLVCTTIIESGLDIPNVNTIVINQADRLGLGQLYQLRGRVGRGAHRAYAYLLYDRRARLTETARQRLQTIFEATELGAGFQIALRDLEIRGAGNLLGAEQSGYMAAVGFDLYVKLLSGAVERMRALLRGELPPPDREGPELTIDLPLSAHLPPSYVPDINQRLALYQRLAATRDPEEVSALGQEMVDRFGAPPPLARNLLYVVALRALGKQAGVQSIASEDGSAVVRAREGETLPREPLSEIVARGVEVGRSTLRVELSEGWRERLRRTLEQLAALNVTGEALEAHSAS
ncbi:MAG: transcription-repair coupling factor [Dehalococcoidia bacterium]|nr:transcription-repair coupling factor [Dehalococcoidia bacterium]